MPPRRRNIIVLLLLVAVLRVLLVPTPTPEALRVRRLNAEAAALERRAASRRRKARRAEYLGARSDAALERLRPAQRAPAVLSVVPAGRLQSGSVELPAAPATANPRHLPAAGAPALFAPPAAQKILVVLVAGAASAPWVDDLVSVWKHRTFSYALFAYDYYANATAANATAANATVPHWATYPWWDDMHRVLGPGMKWALYREHLRPEAVSAYEHIWFVDEDTGLAAFPLWKYVQVMRDNNLSIAQPGIARNDAGGLKANPTSRVQYGAHLGRYTSVVEGGPFVTFAGAAWACVWRLLQSDLKSGWGVDLGWCKYAETRCAAELPPLTFMRPSQCAVVDVAPVTHLDRATSREAYTAASNHAEMAAYRARFPELYAHKRIGFYTKEAEPRLSAKRAFFDAEEDWALTHSRCATDGMCERASRVALLRWALLLDGVYVRNARTDAVAFVRHGALHALAGCQLCNGVDACSAASTVAAPDAVLRHLGKARPFACRAGVLLLDGSVDRPHESREPLPNRTEHARRARRVLEAEWYRELWGELYDT